MREGERTIRVLAAKRDDKGLAARLRTKLRLLRRVAILAIATKRSQSHGANTLHSLRPLWHCLAASAVFGFVAGRASGFAEVTWTGNGSDSSWSTAENWDTLSPPEETDQVHFLTSGTLTNYLESDQSVAGVGYSLPGAFGGTTTDLGGFTLTIADRIVVNAQVAQWILANGSVQVGSPTQPGRILLANEALAPENFAILDVSAARLDVFLHELVVAEASSTKNSFGILDGGNSGSIIVGSAGERGRVTISHNLNADRTEVSVYLASQDSFSATVDRFDLGVAQSGSAYSSLWGARVNVIDALEMAVGAGTNDRQFGNEFVLGEVNTIVADVLTIGTGQANGTVARIRRTSTTPH